MSKSIRENWFLILTLLVLLASLCYRASTMHSGQQQQIFYDQCTEQKGIAVFDIKGEMRCVPMFSALRVKQ